ncbi:MAG: Transcriptional regulator, MerR family [uncultured Nocardioides sp.]|uniref:Transcriptional regulator, MerR family n=1 Tax=uncultured Nocardioides sp. TaxID=198441 RepID=A0A6J4N5U4_9ACTN|nr:MAG: Transcriptional regulator, MerR family [uncultured Nocardioides sp.]
MFTVKRAAELTGLTPDTLRVWERRYGVVAPERSPGGYRLYDDRSLRRLAAMKSLVDSGWSVRAAADHVLEEDTDAGPADPPAASSSPAVPDLGALSAAGQDFDVDALTAALDAGFASGEFERVVDAWLMPSLERLGADWRDGRVTVAAEHFVSAAVQARLASIYESLVPGGGTPVVVGLARGSRHELGVLAFSIAARREGLDVVYVGGDLPPAEWATTVRVRQARAIVIGVPSAEDVPAVRETVQAVRRESPEVQVWLGGGHQGAVGGQSRALGHFIGDAAATLADAIG